MKKIVFITSVILVTGALVYLLIPDSSSVSQSIIINTKPGVVSRALTEKDLWHKWWPADVDEIVYPENNFSLERRISNGVFMLSKEDSSETSVVLNVITHSGNQSKAVLTYDMPRQHANKIYRLKAKREWEQAFSKILQSLKTFSEDEVNIYGGSISEVKVKDSALLITKKVFQYHPETNEIYALIHKLQQSAADAGIKETDHPMLNIDSTSVQGYQVMVAIPVNKLIAPTANIQPRRMVLGKLLMTEVKGGPAAVRNRLISLEKYMDDNKRTSPAIPFQSLVTDRSKVTDSSQWITRIYYPVL